MPSRRHFVNQAPQLTLNVAITSAATSCVVNGSFAGWPTQYPFFASLDYGQTMAEIVSVTNITGTTATIVRSQGGTAAVSHAAGATLDHVSVAQDFDEANAHTSANAGVHGVTGNVVGDVDVQTLSNKTFTGTTTMATVNAGAVSGSSLASTAGVSGIIQPKQYANEAAAGTATLGNLVYLTAPTGGGSPGVYYGNGTVWQMVGGVSGSGVRVGGRAKTNHTVTTASSAAFTVDNAGSGLAWTTLDDSGGYVTTSPTAPLKAVAAGVYIIQVNLDYGSSGPQGYSSAFVALLKNAAVMNPYIYSTLGTSTSEPNGGSLCGTAILAANDTIGVRVAVSTGITLDATISMYKLSN